MKALPKYSENSLIPIFLKAAAFRNEMLKLGFTDNGGAIHSAERILDILRQRLKYPGLSHINNYKHYENAGFSENSRRAYEMGEKILIEHVSPIRDFTCKTIKLVEKNLDKSTDTEQELRHFVTVNYRLALLTPVETMRLNKKNRSQMTDGRLEEAGIIMVS